MARGGVRAAAAVLAACASIGARAAQSGAYIQLDNDFFFDTDRWYTSGVRIADVFPQGDHELEFGVLQEIYTPEAKRHNDVDRPNAARLLATLARHDRTPGDWRTLELDLGVTGPSALGEQAQRFVHRFVTAPHEDWSHQRSDRVDAQAAWSQTRALGAPRDGEPYFNGHYGIVLGSQVAFAHAGIELRYGRGEASRGLETPALRFAATPPIADGDASSWTAFLGTSVRAVAWNHLLDFAPGLARETPQMHHAVGRFLGGVAWTGRGARLTFTLIHETREFVGQRTGADFGSVTLHLTF